jgi:hypothetical protein
MVLLGFTLTTMEVSAWLDGALIIGGTLVAVAGGMKQVP